VSYKSHPFLVMLLLPHNNITMGKGKTFVGQPVLSQIFSCIPAAVINEACKKHKSNRYYKQLPLRVHLVILLYGVFSYCNGLREICEGMLGCEGKLSHLGLHRTAMYSVVTCAVD
jgi:hypothetical protein